MIDRALLPVQRAILAPLARLLAALGVTADALTCAGLALGVLAAAAVVVGWHGLALVLILANRVCDGLDGAVARLEGPTDRGAFVDIAFDFFFYALIPFAFALADPARNALAAAALILAFVGTGSSFLAFAAVAARRGLTADAYPAKGIYYLGGLTEGAETIALLVAMCLWPQFFPVVAWGFAGLCLLTTLTRWRMGWIAFGSEPATERTK
jgi:phosphatidylglycerophosphate synthase